MHRAWELWILDGKCGSHTIDHKEGHTESGSKRDREREAWAHACEFGLPIDSIIVNTVFPIFQTVQIVFGRLQLLIYRIRQLNLLQQIESNFYCKCFDALQPMNTKDEQKWMNKWREREREKEIK